jgi:hypothetical protein
MILCSKHIESFDRSWILIGKQKGSTKSRNLTAYVYVDFHYSGNPFVGL